MLTESMADLPADEADEAAARSGRVSRWVWLVVVLGLSYGVVGWFLGDKTGASRLWWLDPVLLVGFAVGLWLRGRRPDRLANRSSLLPVRSGTVVAFLFIAGSWLTGMLYELSLRTGPVGFGGMHPETGVSFLLAQGHYIPFAVGGWWLARRYGYSLADVFWTGALASLYEMVTVGVPAVVGTPGLWLLAPLLAGYYLYVYALILTMPLLFMDEHSLWSNNPRPISAWGRIWRGVVFGLLYWVVFVGWAAVVE